MEQKISHILDLREGVLFQKSLTNRNYYTVLKNPSKCGGTNKLPLQTLQSLPRWSWFYQ